MGSSNLSGMALGEGVEWNYRVVSSRDGPGFAELSAAFEALLRDPRCQRLTPAWLDAYRARRPRLWPVRWMNWAP